MVKKKTSLKGRHEGMKEIHKKNYGKGHYTNICNDVTNVFNRWGCNLCGAYADTPEEVEHFIHCPLKED